MTKYVVKWVSSKGRYGSRTFINRADAEAMVLRMHACGRPARIVEVRVKP